MLDSALKTVNGRLVMVPEPADSLGNNILLSLHIKRGTIITCKSFGSDLHTIKTLSASNVELAKVLASDALAWLVAKRRVKSITVTAFAQGDFLAIGVSAVRQNFPPKYYETYFKVA